MRNVLFGCSLSATIFLFSTPSVGQQASPATASAAMSDARRVARHLIDAFELVLRRHVSPSTMQQMVLASARKIRGDSQIPEGSLAEEISRSDAREQWKAILAGELMRVSSENGLRPFAEYLPDEFAAAGIRFRAADDHTVDRQFSANRYVGVGIAIHHSGRHPAVGMVIEGGTAEEAGVVKGDLIVEINGRATHGVPLDDILKWIRGPEGSDVRLMLRRDTGEREVVIERRVVPIATVNRPIASESSRTIFISLSRVAASNVHELRRIADDLDPQVTTVVIDFRCRQGCENMHHGELLANALIDDAPVGIVTDRADNRREVRAEPGAIFAGRKLVVVIDAATEGVLKWIAAALQDTGQGTLVGSPATSAALAAESYPLPASDGDTVGWFVTLPVHVLRRASGDSLAASPSIRIPPRFIPRTESQQSPALSPVLMPAGLPPESHRTAGVVYPDLVFSANPQSTPTRLLISGGETSVPRNGKTLGNLIERDLLPNFP